MGFFAKVFERTFAKVFERTFAKISEILKFKYE